MKGFVRKDQRLSPCGLNCGCAPCAWAGIAAAAVRETSPAGLPGAAWSMAA